VNTFLDDAEGPGGHQNGPAELALRVMAGRWKVLIVRELSSGQRRFSALRRSLVGVSHKVLTAQLRELESDGVVDRRVFAQVPPRVEYGLTERGRALLPLLEGLHAWGAAAPSDGASRGRHPAAGTDRRAGPGNPPDSGKIVG
jgi:DNA-binding HxlR family transcriptional regulator